MDRKQERIPWTWGVLGGMSVLVVAAMREMNGNRNEAIWCAAIGAAMIAWEVGRYCRERIALKEGRPVLRMTADWNLGLLTGFLVGFASGMIFMDPQYIPLDPSVRKYVVIGAGVAAGLTIMLRNWISTRPPTSPGVPPT